MYIYEAVGYHILNSTGIQDYTTRVFHGDIPETETTLPAINYFMVSRPNIAFGAAVARPLATAVLICQRGGFESADIL